MRMQATSILGGCEGSLLFLPCKHQRSIIVSKERIVMNHLQHKDYTKQAQEKEYWIKVTDPIKYI